MAAKTAAEMVEILKVALQTSPIGVVQVNIDGRIVQYGSRDDVRKELNYWERRAARESGELQEFMPVSFSGVQTPPCWPM